MKSLQYFGPKDLRFVELPEPEIGATDVLMKVKKVGICGTDLHIYTGGMEVPTPLTLGHEFVGDIVKIGDEVTTIAVGDRAVAEHVTGCGLCQFCLQGKKNLCLSPTVIGIQKPGALAEYLVLPAELVYKLPEELSYDEGVLVEPLSIAVYAVRKAEVTIGDRVAVVGQGPIGLFIDYVAHASGGTVYGFDMFDTRIEYAQNRGYLHKGFNITKENFIEDFKNICSTDGADVVFEAVGSDTSAELALELTKAGGRIVIMGVFRKPVMVDMMQIVRKELKVMGSWTCIFSIDQTLQMLMTQKIDTNQVITHRYKFDDAIRAFEEALTDKSNRIKTVIEFD